MFSLAADTSIPTTGFLTTVKNPTMLRFEDDRNRRNRSNLRALRRTILRVSYQLPVDRCSFKGDTTTTTTPTNYTRITTDWKSDSTYLFTRQDTYAILNNCFDVDNNGTSAVLSPSFSFDLSTTSSSSSSTGTATTATTVPLCSLAYGESPLDLPIVRFLHTTRAWLLSLCERLLSDGYSLTYLRSILSVIRSDSGRAYPLIPCESKAFLRSIIDAKRRYFSNRTIQSDGVYAMNEQMYVKMRLYSEKHLASLLLVSADVDDRSSVSVGRFLFAYLYLMMYHTGKRASDLCNLTVSDLTRLLRDQHIAVQIPKTERIGRISIERSDDPDAFKVVLTQLISVLNRYETLRKFLPYNQFQQRRRLNRMFTAVYELIAGEKKPCGLSFHSLRRRKAANFFKSNQDLETVRECLDHRDSRITNDYINKHLLSSGNY